MDQQTEQEMMLGSHLTVQQQFALRSIHDRYNIAEFSYRDFWHTFDLPDGYAAGWVQRENGDRVIYIGVSPDGQISS